MAGSNTSRSSSVGDSESGRAPFIRRYAASPIWAMVIALSGSPATEITPSQITRSCGATSSIPPAMRSTFSFSLVDAVITAPPPTAAARLAPVP